MKNFAFRLRSANMKTSWHWAYVSKRNENSSDRTCFLIGNSARQANVNSGAQNKFSVLW